MIRGTFVPEGEDYELTYQVISWVDDRQYHYTGRNFNEGHFSRVDRATIEVRDPSEPDIKLFTTIYGPYPPGRDGIDFIKDILAYDFGKDGTLNIRLAK